MSLDPRTPPEVLEDFCAQWNQRGFNPELYPLHMAPENIAQAVLAAQLDFEVENAIEIPSDVDDSESFLSWVRSLESTKTQRQDDRNKLHFLRLVAKDKKGRIAAFDAEVSMTPDGRTLMCPHIKVIADMGNYSQRSSWIDPVMLNEYDRIKSGNTDRRVDSHGFERVELFRKALQAMIRDSLKQASLSKKKEDQRDKEADRTQSLIDEIKGYGTPLKALSEKGHLEVGVGLDDKSEVGAIHFSNGRVTAKITTKATRAERASFAAMLNEISEA